MLDLTGEEQTITITADTVITKQAGGMQPGGDGQNGGAPEKPEGDGQSSDSSDGASDSRTQLTITRKVRIQIARTEKSRKNQTVTDSPQRLRIFHFLTFKEGDIVSITLDEDGNAASITVMSMKWAVGASLAVMDKALRDRRPRWPVSGCGQLYGSK